MDSSLPPAPRRRYWTPSRLFAAAGALAATFAIGLALGASARPAPSSTETTQTISAPASTPTAAPTPLALSGQGSKVLTIDLARGDYRLSWTAQGHDNFAVTLVGEKPSLLVNQIPPEPASGEALARIGGGHYTLQVEAAKLTWSITFAPL